MLEGVVTRNKLYKILKGGYLDFSHLTEYIYITEIYMKKQ